MKKFRSKKNIFFVGEDGSPQKVLLVGLGILGGGTAMAKFILDQGGELTITDLRSKEILKSEIKIVDNYAAKKKKKVVYVLGEHNEQMFDNSDVVLFNPAVPYFSKWPQYCLEKKINFYNDLTLFEEFLFKNDSRAKQIWITGTRGKSTTTTFIHHLLGEKAVIGGNVPGSGLQKISNKKGDYFVLETSNYQLEYEIHNKNISVPDVCVITNIFIDHLNRHKTVEEYRRVKRNIFKYNKNAVLFLNKQEKSLEEIWQNKLHPNIKFINDYGKDFFELKSKYKKFSHNQIVSLANAISIAKYFGVSDKDVEKRIRTLQIPKMRQEVVFENKKFKIINDSTATNPDALVAAIRNYPQAYFISGGTDAELDFSNLIIEINKAKLVKNNKIFLLSGTATDKLREKLALSDKYISSDFEKIFDTIFADLKEGKNKEKVVIVLSPGAKSFGLFKNEYDRGEKFNKIVKKTFK